MPDFNRRRFNGGDPSLPEINRTDRLIDALAGEQPVYSNDPSEAELAYLLAGWRDEVRQAPPTVVLTPRDAAIALDRATSAGRRRRLSLAVVGSVAAAVLCLGGFGSVIYGAGPGDALYGLRTMLFGEQQVTRDDQVALAAQTQMQQVQQLIDQGDWAGAQAKLQTLTTTVAAVDDTARQQELVDQWQQLSVKVEARDPAATVPPDAPPVVLPEVPSDIPLPVLLSPDATSPSSTAPSDPATSSTPSSPTTPTSPTSPLPTPSTSAPTTSPSPGDPSPTPPGTPTPSTAPTSAPSSVPATTPSGAPVEVPPPSTVPSSAPAPTTVVPGITTTVVTSAPVVEESQQAPVFEAPTVQAPPVEAPVTRVPVPQAPKVTVPVTTTPADLPVQVPGTPGLGGGSGNGDGGGE